MTSLKEGQYRTVEKPNWALPNENASAATEALESNPSAETIANKESLRNQAKKTLLESLSLSPEAENTGNRVAPISEPTSSESAEIDWMEEVYQDAETKQPELVVKPELRYKLLSDADLQQLPPISWHIKNVLPSRGLAVVFGPSGAGKSFLVLDMLQSLGFGRDWFGHRVKQCTVTYVVLEGEAGLSMRVNAYRERHGETSANIRYLVQPFKLLNANDINALVEAIQNDRTGDVVVLDNQLAQLRLG